jgi:hypothetical protein
VFSALFDVALSVAVLVALVPAPELPPVHPTNKVLATKALAAPHIIV